MKIAPTLSELIHPTNGTYVLIMKSDDFSIQRRDVEFRLDFSEPIPTSHIQIESINLISSKKGIVLKPIQMRLF